MSEPSEHAKAAGKEIADMSYSPGRSCDTAIIERVQAAIDAARREALLEAAQWCDKRGDEVRAWAFDGNPERDVEEAAEHFRRMADEENP